MELHRNSRADSGLNQQTWRFEVAWLDTSGFGRDLRLLSVRSLKEVFCLFNQFFSRNSHFPLLPKNMLELGLVFQIAIRC